MRFTPAAEASPAPLQEGSAIPELDLRISRPGAVHAAANGFIDPAELFADLLAVGHAAVDLLGRLASQQQRSASHHGGWLATRIIHAGHQLMVDCARRRHDLRGRYGGYRDPIVLRDLLRQTLREPL